MLDHYQRLYVNYLLSVVEIHTQFVEDVVIVNSTTLASYLCRRQDLSLLLHVELFDVVVFGAELHLAVSLSARETFRANCIGAASFYDPVEVTTLPNQIEMSRIVAALPN